MLSDSTAGYREIVCERKSQSMPQTSLLSYFKKITTASPTFSTDHPDQSLRQAPPATERWQFTEASDNDQRFKKLFLLLFSQSVMSDSSQPHKRQHTRLPCPSLSPRVCSKSSPLSQWCHPTICHSVTPFSFSLQSCPASGSFPVSWFFPSGGQSIGASASASILSVNIQDWFPLEIYIYCKWDCQSSLRPERSLVAACGI